MEQDREEEGNRMKKKWEKYFFEDGEGRKNSLSTKASLKRKKKEKKWAWQVMPVNQALRRQGQEGSDVPGQPQLVSPRPDELMRYCLNRLCLTCGVTLGKFLSLQSPDFHLHSVKDCALWAQTLQL